MNKLHVVLATLNAKYIHKNLALRWLFVSAPAGFDVEIIEGVIRDDPLNTAKRIVQSAPDVIGLSVYIFNAKETKQLIASILSLLPSARIILGGPEVTY
ncbi:MAG: cobalamin B12-binding domain-containing protein, partial [Erysipelotrichaceae bacterium]